MKTIFACTLLFFLPFFGQSQANVDWDKLINELVAENWKEATKLSEKYLGQYDENYTGRELNRLRFMHIYAVAGLMGEQKISREKGLKKVKIHEGKQIELPGHPMKPKEKCMFDCIWYAESDTNKTHLWSVSANGDGTFIHAFQDIYLKEAVDLDAQTKDFLTAGGVLKEIRLQGESLSAFAIEITGGYAVISD